MGDKRNLGELKQRLVERYEKDAEQLKNYTPADLIANKFEKSFWKLLQEFGIDYPLDFDRPPPDVYVPARQGTLTLEPQGTTDGATPPVKKDIQCLTWKARDGGFLVVDHLDFIMEDPIAEDFFTITYKFDSQQNTAQFQCDNSVNEPGHWKFNRLVLIDGECMQVCVQNTNAFASGVFSWENVSWSL
jgi:hypothetical protein